MRKCLILFMLTLSLAGCASLNPFKGISDPPQAPKKMGSWEQTSEPVVVGQLADGKYLVANKLTYRAAAEETGEKLTLGQRIGRFFSGLSVAGLLFILASLVFFGGAPIVWVAQKYFAAKRALRNTVKAIKEIPTEQFEAIKPALSSNQDKADKELIARLKAKL